MNLVHDDPEFDALIRIVARKRDLSIALVEKDYWVTHVLWAMHAQGFDIWFKGGTSLSKGFGLIQRFSEDLDLKLDPGTVDGILSVSDWRRTGARVTEERRAYFEWLVANLRMEGVSVHMDRSRADRHWRGAEIQVRYPGRHMARLGADMKPFVLLEVGSARVVPFVPCDLTSFVHEELEAQGQTTGYRDNRPRGVRCVHPLVTLLEKLDALGRRAHRAESEPAVYVRHYEDAARIAEAFERLPPLPDDHDVRRLADEMEEKGQLHHMPSADDHAFSPEGLAHAADIEQAYTRIGPMYWGPRLTLGEAGATIREWIVAHLA